MKTNKTEIIIIADRSGSMDQIKNDVEGGLKTYIEDQKKLGGDCTVTFVQFDTEYEKVFENKPINDVQDIKIQPRGGTALLDALGKTINDVGIRLAAMKEEDRPSQVNVLLVSDGQENSSKEFTNAKIKSMIELQSKTYSWKFNFLGCSGFDAVAVGNSYGIGGQSINFATTKAGIANAFAAASNATSFYRCSTDLSAAYSYSQEERDAAADVINKSTITTNKVPTVKTK